MGNRASSQPPSQPPKWQQVIAPASREEGEAPEPPSVLLVPEDRIKDPRELAPSFARLPDHAKEELRDRWRAQEGVHGKQVLRRKETSHRWVIEGASVFFLSVALFLVPTGLGLLLAAAVGGAIGYAAARVKPGALRYGVLFAAFYAAFAGFWGFKSLFLGILSIPFVFGVAAALATTHRLQRFDSTEL